MAVFSIPIGFPLSVLERLAASGVPAADRRTALAVLSVLAARLEPQSYATGASAW